MLKDFEQYQKVTIAYFRDYIPGESLSDIKICPGVTPCAGGKIGIDPKNTIDQWYISPEALAQHYTAVKSTEPVAKSTKSAAKSTKSAAKSTKS